MGRLLTLKAKYKLWRIYQAVIIAIFLVGLGCGISLVVASSRPLMADRLPIDSEEYKEFVLNRDIADLQTKRVEDTKRIEKLEQLIEAQKSTLATQSAAIDRLYSYLTALGTFLTIGFMAATGLKTLLARPATLKQRQGDE